MTRSEARTAEAWRAYDGAVLILALFGLLALLLLAWMGNGPTRAGCCAAPVAAMSTAVQPTVPAPLTVPAPEPNKAEPTVAAGPPQTQPATTESPKPEAAPAVDCSKVLDGASLLFAFNSAELTQETRATLDKTPDCLKAGRYEVAGHTDNIGSRTANQNVSEARARAVVAYLQSVGVDASKLSAIGLADTRPVASNATAEGRARNRRVTFTRLP